MNDFYVFSPPEMMQFGLFKNCFLIKFQNSLKISVFIPTTTKKAASLLGRYGTCSLWNILKKWCNLVHFN